MNYVLCVVWLCRHGDGGLCAKTVAVLVWILRTIRKTVSFTWRNTNLVADTCWHASSARNCLREVCSPTAAAWN